jgi:hypothetical protein
MKNVYIELLTKCQSDAVIGVLSGTRCLWCGVPGIQNSSCSVEGLFFSLCLSTAYSTSVCWCYRGMYCLHVQGDWIVQMEAVRSSVVLVGTRTTWPVDPRNSLHFKVAFVSPLVLILVAKGAVRLLLAWSNQMCTDQHEEIYRYCEIFWNRVGSVWGQLIVWCVQ